MPDAPNPQAKGGNAKIRCATAPQSHRKRRRQQRSRPRKFDMQFTSSYQSPIGKILLAAEEAGLTGLWFEGQKYFALRLDAEHEERETPILAKAKKWLDIYFSGKQPEFAVPLRFAGTPFQNEVWKILLSIPYGKTMTYGEIARKIAARKGLARMSAQAAGGAQRNFNHNTVPPRRRNKRQPDGICGRNRKENKIASARRRRHEAALYPEKGNRSVNPAPASTPKAPPKYPASPPARNPSTMVIAIPAKPMLSDTRAP